MLYLAVIIRISSKDLTIMCAQCFAIYSHGWPNFKKYRWIGGYEMNSTSLRSSVHLGAVPPAACVSSQGFKGAYTILTCVYEHVDLYSNVSGIILT